MGAIQGWMGKGPSAWLAAQARTHSRIIEVGCWKGRSTRIMADATQGTVWAVDHWQGTPKAPEHAELYAADIEQLGTDGLYAEFCANLAPHIESGRVVPMRMSSAGAARKLLKEHGQTFDFVFIDADHTHSGASADIKAYRKLVAPGGILAGHDYKAKFPGVQQAVDELLQDVTVGPASIWSVVL